MGVGDHEVSATTEHSGELGEHWLKRRQVCQCEPCEHHVRRRVFEGQGVQVGFAPVDLWEASSGNVEHLRRGVDADDVVFTF